MKIKGERPGVIIELSAEELETLSTLLENVDITKLWYEHGCRYEQVGIGFGMRSTIKDFLSGKVLKVVKIKRTLQDNDFGLFLGDNLYKLQYMSEGKTTEEDD